MKLYWRNLRSAALMASGILSTVPSWGTPEPIPIPDRPFDILDNYCLNCHDDVEFKGEINLDMDTVQWDEEDAIHLWSRVIKMV